MLLNFKQFKYFVPGTEAAYIDSYSCILFDTTIELSVSHILGHADPPGCIAKWIPPSHFHQLDFQVCGFPVDISFYINVSGDYCILGTTSTKR